jgi:hypothetical protein
MKWGEVRALVGGPVVGHDRDRRQFTGVGIDAVLEEWMPEQSFGLGDRRLDRRDRVAGRGRARDRRGQADLGRVVEDRADPPGAAAARLELGEVGLPDPIAPGRRGHEQGSSGDRQRSSLGLVADGDEQVPAGQGAQDR